MRQIFPLATDLKASVKAPWFGTPTRVGFWGAVCVLMMLAAPAHVSAGDDATAHWVSMLGSNAGLEAKYEACRQLARAGDERAVAPLAHLLGDEKLTHMARYALEPMPGEAASQALREALPKLKGDALSGVIDSLGRRRDAAAVAILKTYLDCPKTDIAAAAAGALGAIGTPAAATVLQDNLANVTPARRPTVAAACLACGQHLSQDGDSAAAGRLYDVLRRAEVPPHMVLAATRGLIVTRGAEGLPLLQELLSGHDPALRGLALGLARNLPGRRVTEACVATLPTLAPDVQAQLIAALSDRDDTGALPAIRTAARSKSPEVRLAAIRAFGVLRDAASVDMLLAAAGTAADRPDEAAAAVSSLRLLPGTEIAPGVVAALPNAAPELRVALIALLASHGDANVVGQLIEQARSGDGGVSAAAWSALAALAGPEHLAQLAELLAAGPAEPALAPAIRAVTAVAARVPDVSRRAEAVVRVLSTTADSAGRGRLLQALAGVANFQAFDILRTALDDADPTVRDVALRALAAWPDATPASLLLDRMAKATDPVHRTLALRGVMRMAGMVAADCDSPSAQVLRWFTEVSHIAGGPDEKKLLLSGLSGLRHPVALELALNCLDDPSVQAEAALAVVTLAPAVGAAGYGAAAEAALERLKTTVKDPALLARVTQALHRLGEEGGMIRAWQICGPYVQRGKECQQLYGVPFPPEQNQAKAKWRLLPPTRKPNATAVDVGSTLPGNHRVAYARTWLLSPTGQDATLELGFDDGGKVWLNGAVVGEANTAGACVPGAHKAQVELRAGRNLLFLKLTQHSGPWEFCLRVVGRDGKPLPGLRVSASEEPGAAPAPAAVEERAPAPPEADFSDVPAVSLFDGKTLSGWEGAPGCFRVIDGAIVGGQLASPITVSDYLCTTRQFGDFELTAQVRTLGVKTNGGIQFRGARVPGSHAMSGLQADVCDGAYWGCLYDCGLPGFAVHVPQQELSKVLRVGDWNEYRIRAVGPHIQLWLNGYQTVDWTATAPTAPKTGLIGLQTHQGPPGEGWYRKILIRAKKPE